MVYSKKLSNKKKLWIQDGALSKEELEKNLATQLGQNGQFWAGKMGRKSVSLRDWAG